jgi:hypothetical protein
LAINIITLPHWVHIMVAVTGFDVDNVHPQPPQTKRFVVSGFAADGAESNTRINTP